MVRLVRKLLKKACVLVGLGLVFLPSIFILLDLQSTRQTSVISQTNIKKLQQSTKTAGENSYISRGEEHGKDHQETNAIRLEEPLLQKCLERDKETSRFREILLGSVLYSAFLDNRLKHQPFIRVISILPSYGEPTQMYCHFQDLKTNEYFTSVMELEELGTSHGFSYLGFIASCDPPEQIDITSLCFVNISIQPEAYLQTNKNTRVIPLHATDHKVNTENYHLCVPPITGQISVARLVEFLELSQILGVSHFTFYNIKGTDSRVLEVLKYYKHQGLVTVLPWDLPYYMPANVFNNGRVAAINDCLYRSIGKFALAAVHDLDEFIAPLAEKKIPKMLQSIQEEYIAGNCFQSYNFNTLYFRPDSKTQLLTQRFKFRTKTSNAQLTRCIVNPAKIFSLDISTVPNVLEHFYNVRQADSSLGYVFRYGGCGVNEEDCAETQEDLTMVKYREELEMRFNLTMAQLIKQGIA